MSAEIRLRAEKLPWLETEGEVIALDETASLYLSANRSGSLLWQELAAGTTRARLTEVIVETFGIDVETAAKDVDRFLAELAERGLLDH